jgi:hypothetical protein
VKHCRASVGSTSTSNDWPQNGHCTLANSCTPQLTHLRPKRNGSNGARLCEPQQPAFRNLAGVYVVAHLIKSLRVTDPRSRRTAIILGGQSAAGLPPFPMPIQSSFPNKIMVDSFLRPE